MSDPIQAAIRGFKEIILGGIPLLLQRNETAFLAFMCTLSAVDALSGYPYTTGKVGERYSDFIRNYFPDEYSGHADKLWLLSCRMLHNFSPAHFTLVHSQADLHLKTTTIGDTYLSDDRFFAALEIASRRFFEELSDDAALQITMDSRLADVSNGGAIYF